MALPEPPLTGGCQCGACRYEIGASPVDLYCCHCTECRAQSASAFGISLITPAEGFRYTAGAPATWVRATATGGEMACEFCPDCGTRLAHRRRGGDRVSVKGGSLDEAVDLSDATHIWTRSALPGSPIPAGARTWPEGPPPAG